MNITVLIKIDNSFITYNIPFKLDYKNKIYNFATRDYYDDIQ